MRWLTVAAIGEDIIGLALLIAPSPVGRLLLGAPLGDIAELLARVLGIALLALGIACWPGPARLGMLLYGGAVAAYLAYVALFAGLVGALLWPAVIVHVVLVVLLGLQKPSEPQLRDRGANTKESSSS